MSKDIPIKQRALVLQGGGALGAYEAGVLKALYKHISKEDKKNGKNDSILFDVIAGSSIGAMNGTVLVSQFLMTGNWMDAIRNLVKFWKDEELGLASNTPDIKIDDKDWLKDNWYQEYLNSASKEAARRYYSTQYFNRYGAQFFTPLKPRPDFKFFDDESILSKWFIYSNEPLKNTIQNFAKFPIKTNFENNEPRLLVFAVDVEEGEMVTFDSYPTEDDFRKSEYGRHEKFSGFKQVIKYPGITIEHVMASGTVPLIYDYAKVPIDQILEQETNVNTNNVMAKEDNKNNKKIRYFWDSGLLNNTPFRELLQAHQSYWGKNKESKVPDLDVYIVNLHPKKISRADSKRL